MTHENLDSDNLIYLADILSAIDFLINRLTGVSPATLDELEECLQIAEAALRRASTEMKMT